MASSQQLEDADGTQWPLWQVFDAHWLLAVHSEVSESAQVFDDALHRPPTHTAAPLAQVPSCSPSLGTG
ncbi:MAG: hypothetical protein DI536_15240 [Archangium gephyra]|uniref:Uncharacterized protein n=1 Tax=Archangium gephyra TaxID=48 RepID=A0A2W5T9R6_9BACT|nr:MAG: hypothetical protein DI536_15240 [Archangium gephyra]